MVQLLITEQSPLYQPLTEMVRSRRVIFLAGLPGVGKSLFLQQLALLAQALARPVHLLQWDVTRASFETADILNQYPEIEGVTHAMIRKAVGMWARDGVAAWANEFPADHLLIGEVPLIGNRLMELAQVHEDAAEPLLASAQTLFVIPTPSVGVRTAIEQARQATITQPQHEREAADAPPNVLQGLWEELYQLAGVLGLLEAEDETPPYDPTVYAGVYEHLLQHRPQTVLAVDELLRPSGSVYDVPGIVSELAASPEEVARIINHLESTYTAVQIEEAVAGWYQLFG